MEYTLDALGVAVVEHGVQVAAQRVEVGGADALGLLVVVLLGGTFAGAALKCFTPYDPTEAQAAAATQHSCTRAASSSFPPPQW